MQKTLFSLSLMFVISLNINAKTYDLQKLGADATGKKKCTELINKTVKQASAEGGGTLYFAAGTYLTGAIHLESNITLDIEAGATLKFSDSFDDYLPYIKVRWEGVFMNSFQPLINAQNAENLTIRGRGTLEGQGEKWWAAGRTAGRTSRGEKIENNPIEKYQEMWDTQNADVKVEDYYKSTILRRFFRPPFIQFFECKNIIIEGIKIQNSPFWTINPVGCENIVVQGVTINNPHNSPNTDGINPSSCSYMRISNCFINVGDDCITIKSGRDADGRAYGKPCQDITITNCVMLSGHGGVVIGSEMSGGVKKISISNCVFDGTDAGIRLKSTRARGGVVEEIRVNNIVMNNIQKNCFIFDLFYTRTQPEPVSERTPIFRNIHISNVTGNNVKKLGYINGLDEMPIENISFSNINIAAENGFTASLGNNIRFDNCDFAVTKGASFAFTKCNNVVLNNVSSSAPVENQAIVELDNTSNVLINNCFQIAPADLFLKSKASKYIWGNNFLQNVKTEKLVE